AILSELMENEATRSRMKSALARWRAPDAADHIAGKILRASVFAGHSLENAAEAGQQPSPGSREFSAA
ncbi:MAG: hypothetical protein ACREFR_12830, partial [Limisphaerales bacterium]